MVVSGSLRAIGVLDSNKTNTVLFSLARIWERGILRVKASAAKAYSQLQAWVIAAGGARSSLQLQCMLAASKLPVSKRAVYADL